MADNPPTADCSDKKTGVTLLTQHLFQIRDSLVALARQLHEGADVVQAEQSANDHQNELTKLISSMDSESVNSVARKMAESLLETAKKITEDITNNILHCARSEAKEGSNESTQTKSEEVPPAATGRRIGAHTLATKIDKVKQRLIQAEMLMKKGKSSDDLRQAETFVNNLERNVSELLATINANQVDPARKKEVEDLLQNTRRIADEVKSKLK